MGKKEAQENEIGLSARPTVTCFGSCAREAAQRRVQRKKTQNGFQRDRHRRLSLPDCRAYWRTTKRGCAGVWRGGERGSWRRRETSEKWKWRGNTAVFLSPLSSGERQGMGLLCSQFFFYYSGVSLFLRVSGIHGATRVTYVIKRTKERG